MMKQYFNSTTMIQSTIIDRIYWRGIFLIMLIVAIPDGLNLIMQLMENLKGQIHFSKIFKIHLLHSEYFGVLKTKNLTKHFI